MYKKKFNPRKFIKFHVEQFKSEKYNDLILLKHPSKILNDTKARFIIKSYDNFGENIKLIDDIYKYIIKNNIKWISFIIKGKYTKPVNSVLYENKKRNDEIVCHIEDFKKFYYKNMSKIILPKNVFIEKPKKKSGNWTKIISINKLRLNKYNNISNQAKTLNSNDDWTLLA